MLRVWHIVKSTATQDYSQAFAISILLLPGTYDCGWHEALLRSCDDTSGISE